MPVALRLDAAVGEVEVELGAGRRVGRAAQARAVRAGGEDPAARAHVVRGDERGRMVGVAGGVAQAAAEAGGRLAGQAGERAAVVAVVVGELAAGAERDEPPLLGDRAAAGGERAGHRGEPRATPQPRQPPARRRTPRRARRARARRAGRPPRPGSASRHGAEELSRLAHPALAVGERAALGEGRVERAAADVAEQRLEPRGCAQPARRRRSTRSTSRATRTGTSATQRAASAMPCRSSAADGTAISAERDGVYAAHATWLQTGTLSVWPIAVMTGFAHAKSARHSRSSSNATRSCTEPPPRAMTMTSTSGCSCIRASASMRSRGAARALDERRAGDDVHGREAVDQRADDVATSRRTPRPAMTPTARGKRGSGLRRAGSRQPLGGEALEQLGAAAQQLALAGEPDRR